MTPTFLISLTVVSIVVLLLLIILFRMQAFIALLLVSIGVALAAGIPAGEVISTIQEGMGGTLGYIAIVIGVGTMIGEMLQVSGGAHKIADTIVRGFGEQKARWALVLIGLIVAIPVFFEVALLLFIPLVYDMARRTGKSVLYYGLPLAAGMAVAHACIPPTPGPVAVSVLLGADLGWVIFFGFIAGVPAAMAGGIYFGKYISGRIHVSVPEHMLAKAPDQESGTTRREAGFKEAVIIILIPVVLILMNTAASVLLPEEQLLTRILSMVGHPFIALMISVLLSFYFLGTRLGFTRDEVQQIATKSLQPVGLIILLTGAGGVFGRVLVTAGVGDVLTDMLAATNLPIVLFAFILATTIRVAQGSATVAMVTTAGLMAPVVDATGISAPLIGVVVIATALGATVISHVNDTGFWLVKELMGMTEKQTLLSWTIMETIIGVTGLVVLLVVSWFL